MMRIANKGHSAVVLTRAIALVDEETACLRQSGQVDYASILSRKSMIAFELEAIAKTAEMLLQDEDLKAQLRALRAKLEENRKLLEVHVSASREILRMLGEVVRAADSDGTYFVSQYGRGRAS